MLCQPMRKPHLPRLLTSALLLLALGSCGRPQPDGHRVLILGLDGLDPRAVDLLMAEGKMANFKRLRQGGAFGKLLSTKPLLSPIIWTTIATGKRPDVHGIGHFTAIDNATGEKRPVTSRMRRVKALWNIASEARREVAVVGWWATWPAEKIRGNLVSDHTAYHFLFAEGFSQEPPSAADTYPAELAQRIAPLLRRPSDLPFAEIAPFAHFDPAEAARRRALPFDFNDELRHLEWALATAKSYRDIGLELWNRDQPDLEMVYIEGTDSLAHLFGHLFRTEGLSGDLARQQRLYGDAVEQMYLLADAIVGQYLDALDDRSTLVVLSDHGFNLGTLHDNPNLTADMRRVSERFHNIEGVLYLYGRGIQPGGKIERPAILDIAPTVLTLLGLPAASDMPGRILDEVLSEEPAAPRVASYESAAGDGPSATSSEQTAAIDQAVLERLKSLGYLGGAGSSGEAGKTGPAAEESSPTGERNLAGILFEEGKYREAARLYKKLIENDPGDASLRTSFAGTLGALNRYDEAIEQLRLAIKIDPLNIEAYHNRAVIAEHRGDVESAIADYRQALRYAPDFAPSRTALRRLTGRATVDEPRTAGERQAFALADRASDAARRGDYDQAWELLDQAVAIAPEYPLIYQYRANVAYLRGDREAAIRSLQKALRLEPDNVLFQQNLQHLQH